MNVQSFPSLHTYRKKDQNLTKHKYIHAVEKINIFPDNYCGNVIEKVSTSRLYSMWFEAIRIKMKHDLVAWSRFVNCLVIFVLLYYKYVPDFVELFLTLNMSEPIGV